MTTNNFVQQIYDFNSQAGLLKKGYFDYLESSFQVEEALEGFDLRALWAKLEDFNSGVTAITSTIDELTDIVTAKHVSRQIMHHALNIPEFGDPKDLRKSVLSDVDRLDKAIDAIVFGLGSIYKLKLTTEQASRAISIVCEANLQKLSMPKDEHGKLTKPSDFVGPEIKLQEILDERI